MKLTGAFLWADRVAGDLEKFHPMRTCQKDRDESDRYQYKC